ncbi:membrane protein insertase YidC [Streptomonospora nanhaiensis]|uniref:Membrane protein insertase YidC n=1 Tax=Streptomonospora nanhaiensis TaxID=1323731 RepID=A0A853BQT9_9ACTN|nr:membrane protein insertase YidC [Streptomonospora nanhaiensis]MBV2364095.1 membrane protein insertase YidC [Streptomonospora nanhaiensis]MBX9387967.1 membrane protein insertase YidC [Streptomonospora nanhaiensis]NYI97095.1 YidC/Oxa1 family membrane protein insertase [Streptomonospora nanhaiensis]
MLDPLYNAVGWVLIQIHSGLTAVGLDPDSGWAWGLSIVLLTVLMRLIMVPLFVKQMQTQRKIQEMQPQLLKVRERYKNDKQRLQQEQMKLYQESGTNPLMGCLPLLLQMPVFFALFSVLRSVAQGQAQYGFTPELVVSAQNAAIFHAPLAAQFLMSEQEFASYNADPLLARVVIAIACIIMGTTTFLTMRQSMKRSAGTLAPDNPMAQSQRIMMYLAPAFGLFGLGMPIGVLIYWVTSNVWTMGQQHFIYRNQPAPGEEGASKQASPNGSAKGLLGKRKESAPEPVEQPKIERKQPKKQTRAKRSGGSPRK